jgi:hypothetical protein
MKPIHRDVNRWYIRGYLKFEIGLQGFKRYFLINSKSAGRPGFRGRIEIFAMDGICVEFFTRNVESEKLF